MFTLGTDPLGTLALAAKGKLTAFSPSSSSGPGPAVEAFLQNFRGLYSKIRLARHLGYEDNDDGNVRELYQYNCPKGPEGFYNARLVQEEEEGKELYALVPCNPKASSSASFKSKSSSGSSGDSPFRLGRLIEAVEEGRELYAVENPCCIPPSVSSVSVSSKSRSSSSKSSSSSSASSSSKSVSSSSASLSASSSSKKSLSSSSQRPSASLSQPPKSAGSVTQKKHPSFSGGDTFISNGCCINREFSKTLVVTLLTNFETCTNGFTFTINQVVPPNPVWQGVADWPRDTFNGCQMGKWCFNFICFPTGDKSNCGWGFLFTDFVGGTDICDNTYGVPSNQFTCTGGVYADDYICICPDHPNDIPFYYQQRYDLAFCSTVFIGWIQPGTPGPHYLTIVITEPGF